MAEVFITWSGERSKQVAEKLRTWLPEVIQAVKPWMSEEDIRTGGNWLAELVKKLSTSQFGIACVTPDNQDAPWMNFEAGAIAKAIQESHVCPYLIDMRKADLRQPLAQFQAVEADRDGTMKLLEEINTAVATETRLSEVRLKDQFSRCWKDLNAVLRRSSVPESPVMRREPDEVLAEILEVVRSISRSQEIGSAAGSVGRQYLNLVPPGKLAYTDLLSGFSVSPIPEQWLPGLYPARTSIERIEIPVPRPVSTFLQSEGFDPDDFDIRAAGFEAGDNIGRRWYELQSKETGTTAAYVSVDPGDRVRMWRDR